MAVIASEVGINNPLYWDDEAFILDEIKLKDIKNVDIVITHSAPEWCYPDNRPGFNDFVLSYAKHDPSLLTELKAERELISKMFKILKDNGNRIKKHFYGHFHKSEYTLNGLTEHILLGVNELQNIDNRGNYNEIK